MLLGCIFFCLQKYELLRSWGKNHYKPKQKKRKGKEKGKKGKEMKEKGKRGRKRRKKGKEQGKKNREKEGNRKKNHIFPQGERISYIFEM